MATVLKKGFFRGQPKNEAYAVEYGSIVVVVGYDGTFITTPWEVHQRGLFSKDREKGAAAQGRGLENCRFEAGNHVRLASNGKRFSGCAPPLQQTEAM